MAGEGAWSRLFALFSYTLSPFSDPSRATPRACWPRVLLFYRLPETDDSPLAIPTSFYYANLILVTVYLFSKA
jgi:hypothetical protein